MYTYIPISPPSCVSLPPSRSQSPRWTQSTVKCLFVCSVPEVLGDTLVEACRCMKESGGLGRGSEGGGTSCWRVLSMSLVPVAKRWAIFPVGLRLEIKVRSGASPDPPREPWLQPLGGKSPEVLLLEKEHRLPPALRLFQPSSPSPRGLHLN